MPRRTSIALLGEQPSIPEFRGLPYQDRPPLDDDATCYEVETVDPAGVLRIDFRTDVAHDAERGVLHFQSVLTASGDWALKGQYPAMSESFCMTDAHRRAERRRRQTYTYRHVISGALYSVSLVTRTPYDLNAVPELAKDEILARVRGRG